MTSQSTGGGVVILRWMTRMVVVAVALLTAGCSADEPDAETQPAPTAVGGVTETTIQAETAPPTEETDRAEAGDAADPTASLRLVSEEPVERELPAGATEVAFRGFVGASAEDPRFAEVSLLHFDEPADAAALLQRLRDRAFVVDVGSEDMAVAFLEGGAAPGQTSRQLHDLTALGPSPDSLFARSLADGRMLYGAARSLHQLDIVSLLESLGEDEGLDLATPPGMQSSVESPLGTGTQVEFRSLDGPVVLSLFDDASAWFEFATHGHTAPLPDELEASTWRSSLSHQPPSSFSFSGQPTEPQILTTVVGPNLVTIDYPPDMAQEVVLALLSRTTGLSEAELVPVLGDGETITQASPAEGPADRGPVAAAPDSARLAELQAFAEAERGLVAAGPIEFDFLTEFPVDAPPAFFVPPEMWVLAVMLDLVDPTVHDPTSAGEARVERLRGIPGGVVLQPSAAFTETIVVHEIIHVLEADAGSAAPSHEVVNAPQALVEGSAQRVALAWFDTLDPETGAEFGQFPWIFPESGDPRLSPEMQDLIEFAYDEGAFFALALHESGGNDGLDAAFVNPPTTSEHIMFPRSYLSGDEPLSVDAPSLAASAREVSSGSIGAFVLSLAIRQGDATTPEELDLVRGWAGDHYAVYDLDDERCLTARIVMDNEPSAAALATALRSNERVIVHDGTGLRLDVCRAQSF